MTIASFPSDVPAGWSAGGVIRIICFHTTPAEQPRLAKLLSEGIERHVASFDGFISATIFSSTDVTKVINLAVWRDEASWMAMENDPVASVGLAEPFKRAVATDLHTYRVERVIHPRIPV